MAIKIMITDDHSMIREGLKNLLELEGDIEVIAEAEDGEDCLNKLLTVKPDVLLLDINMPKLNGLEVLKKLKERKSKVKVLVLTVHNETEYLMKAVEIGINGYVLKDSESSELKKAIYAIYDGENYYYLDEFIFKFINLKLILFILTSIDIIVLIFKTKTKEIYKLKSIQSIIIIMNSTLDYPRK